MGMTSFGNAFKIGGDAANLAIDLNTVTNSDEIKSNDQKHQLEPVPSSRRMIKINSRMDNQNN